MISKADDIVAIRIVEALKVKQVIQDERLVSLAEPLARGTLTAEDWALLVELAVDRGSGDGRGRSD